MDVDLPHDFISELPLDIIEAILAKLPIKYAVRTCVLSRSWRNKWTSMTHVTFDDTVNPSKKPFASSANRFINGFLSTHVGPIHEFNLSTDESDGPELDKWLHHVRQKDVKKLDIRGRGPFVKKLTRIFSCKKLTRLKLAWCKLKPPPSFEGFLRMKHLVLLWVAIPGEDMECLISSCPLLEDLTLAESDDYELTIRAPNLKCLNLRGRFGDVCLENTPLLADMTVAPNEHGYLDFA